MSIHPSASVLVVILAALAGCGGGDRSASSAAPQTESATPAAAGQANDEFSRMRSELRLTPDQDVAFSAKVAAREAALKAWNDGPDGKRMAAARAERTATTDDAKRSALDAEIKELNQALWKVRTAYRSEVMQVLSSDQQRAWASARLAERLLKSYGKLGLEEPQRVSIQAAARDAVTANPPDVISDPYLGKALDPARLAAEQQIEGTILTAAQRATLAERREQRKRKKAEAAPATDPAAR